MRQGHRPSEPALHDMDQNRIWLAVDSLACELTAWLQMHTLIGHPARRWEPKRLRLFSIAGRPAGRLAAAAAPSCT